MGAIYNTKVFRPIVYTLAPYTLATTEQAGLPKDMPKVMILRKGALSADLRFGFNGMHGGTVPYIAEA